jgi:CheY-like chemotaxis protein
MARHLLRGYGNYSGVLAMRTVLVVEDDLVVRSTLRLMLEQWGYRVAEAENGLRGIEAATEWHDFVFVDLSRPLLDGCAVVRKVKAIHGDQVVVVGISGSRLPEDRVRLLAAGVDFHFVKPVDPHALRALLLAA